MDALLDGERRSIQLSVVDQLTTKSLDGFIYRQLASSIEPQESPDSLNSSTIRYLIIYNPLRGQEMPIGDAHF